MGIVCRALANNSLTLGFGESQVLKMDRMDAERELFVSKADSFMSKYNVSQDAEGVHAKIVQQGLSELVSSICLFE